MGTLFKTELQQQVKQLTDDAVSYALKVVDPCDEGMRLLLDQRRHFADRIVDVILELTAHKPDYPDDTCIKARIAKPWLHQYTPLTSD